MRVKLPAHHIQKTIYSMLVASNGLRYSQLKPSSIEANVFMYHLNELIKSGLVIKADGLYRLSSAGLDLSSRFSLESNDMRQMSNAISMLVLKAYDGEYLLYKRSRQPYLGMLSFPTGMVHHGDTLEQAAYRKLKEKCGYDIGDVRLEQIGIVSIVHEDIDSVVFSSIMMVWEGVVKKKLTHMNPAGETFWGALDGLTDASSDTTPGLISIVESLEKPDFFVLDLKISDKHK